MPVERKLFKNKKTTIFLKTAQHRILKVGGGTETYPEGLLYHLLNGV